MKNLNKISTIFQNNKKENIIVFAIMALIVIITLVTIGLDPIKHWLAEPIIWKDADFLNIYLVDKVQKIPTSLLFYSLRLMLLPMN